MGNEKNNLELPERIHVCECWTRDGLQNEKTVVSKEDKIRMINWFQDMGFTEIEVTNFANPKYLPQFKDIIDVLQGINQKPDVNYRVVVTNMRGMDRCVEAKNMGLPIKTVIIPMSASEAHNLANVKMTHKENMAIIEEIAKKVMQNNLILHGWVLTSFGCPIQGDVPIEIVERLGRWWKEDLGADKVGFGDTTGMCNPKYATYFYEYMKDKGFKTDEMIAHFHDTRGTGIANNVAAIQAGLVYFDTSLGAIGGQPATGAEVYHYGFSGNTCTEDLVCMFEEMGIDTGINIDELIKAGLEAEKILGRQLRSNVIRCGPVKNKSNQ